MYFFIKFIKLLAVLTLCSGCACALWMQELEAAKRWAFRVAMPAFGVTWTAGFGLAAMAGHSLLGGWILGALFLSLVCTQVLIFAVSKPGRRTTGVKLTTVALLVGCMALMVWRPGA